MKRKRISKFEPYTDEIAKYVITGMCVREIAELIECHFDDVVDVNALYGFMRKKGMPSRYD